MVATAEYPTARRSRMEGGAEKAAAVGFGCDAMEFAALPALVGRMNASLRGRVREGSRARAAQTRDQW